MLETVMSIGVLPSLLLSALSAALLSAGGVLLLQRRKHQPRKDETARLRHALRGSKAQVEDLRKQTEELKAELLEWRRRSLARQSSQAGSSSRFAASAPASEPNAWVLGALLQGDSQHRASELPEFADTQILPSTRH